MARAGEQSALKRLRGCRLEARIAGQELVDKNFWTRIPGGGDAMTTRRGFLKGAGAAGIAFCGCGMLDAARAQEPGRRLPVMVKDKRVKTIDVHSHCLFHDAVNLMGEEARNVFTPVKGAENQYIV